MNTQTTKPLSALTVREFGDMAYELGITFVELLDAVGPIPTPPAGYTLAPKSESRWIGTETMARGWIITPVWDATTNTHSLDLWAANHEPPNYATMTLAEARQLAADLMAAAETLPGGEN